MASNQHLRLVLIGKTGAGKSKSGNTILNSKTFFRSGSQGSSLTEICHLRENIVFGRRVSVVDTPGLLDTNKEEQEVLHEITKCIYMSAPGPHAIILIVQIGRFTSEDVYTLQKFVKHFGDELLKYLVIAFTRYDDFKRDMEDKGNDTFSIHDYISTLPDVAKEFVMTKCYESVIGLDNTLKGSDAEQQIQELFSIIDTVIAKNEGKCYTNNDYKKAEDAVREEMRKEEIRIKQELDDKLEKRIQEIEAAADEKARIQIKEQMESMKSEIEERLSYNNLRLQVQQSPKEEFFKFQQNSDVYKYIADFALKGFQLYVDLQKLK